MLTRERLIAQYAKNAKQLRSMADKARAVAPKKVRGYTFEQLDEMATRYERMAAGDLTELQRSLERLRAGARNA